MTKTKTAQQQTSVAEKPTKPVPKLKPLRLSRSAIEGEKYTGPEPQWDTERAIAMTEDDFNLHLTRAMNYYNYFYTPKDIKKYFVEWASLSERVETEQVKKFEATPDKYLTMTPCSVIAAHYAGMPLKEQHIQYLLATIQRTIELHQRANEANVEEKPKQEVPKPSIQDIMAEKTAEVLGEFEGHFDHAIAAKTNFKFYDFLQENRVPQVQLKKYEEVIERKLIEFQEVLAKKDEQLTEGYKFLKVADVRRIITFLEECNTAIEQYRDVKRATKKLRVKKAPSKEKLIAKLKYKTEDKELKLVSIPPTSILSASVLWVFNTKTRKLGKYVADEHAKTLSVKGTTIEGFDASKSVCKTLRKPAEQLQEFMKSGKVKLRKFLEEIRATETKMTGRISSDIILLKAEW